MRSESASIPVIIAAGGDGSRLGGDKPNRLLAGERLIDRALIQARNWSCDIAVALRAETALALPPTIPTLTDAETNGGPLSALANALSYGVQQRASHVLLIACDMPFLPRNLLTTLLAYADNGAVIAKSDERLHPACSLWPATAVHSLNDYAATGRRSLLGLAERIGFVTAEWSAIPIDPFFNINSNEDLRMAENLLAQNANA